jgi:hypothetical protein
MPFEKVKGLTLTTDDINRHHRFLGIWLLVYLRQHFANFYTENQASLQRRVSVHSELFPQ